MAKDTYHEVSTLHWHDLGYWLCIDRVVTSLGIDAARDIAKKKHEASLLGYSKSKLTRIEGDSPKAGDVKYRIRELEVKNEETWQLSQ